MLWCHFFQLTSLNLAILDYLKIPLYLEFKKRLIRVRILSVKMNSFNLA